MNLSRVVLLSAFSARSQTYAQAFANAGFKIGGVLAFGNTSDHGLEGNDKARLELTDLFVPDFSETIFDTCERAGWLVCQVKPGDVNDPAIKIALSELDPSLIIYSGYAGQLVGAGILAAGVPILHMHAGWLPDYRGSTTVYYSWLEESRCRVSAILLDHAIDTGPIIARRFYPPPPEGVDVDNLYDNAIRADLATRVLEVIRETGDLPNAVPQDKQIGRTYYVIHPVLKHLALMSKA